MVYIWNKGWKKKDEFLGIWNLNIETPENFLYSYMMP